MREEIWIPCSLEDTSKTKEHASQPRGTHTHTHTHTHREIHRDLTTFEGFGSTSSSLSMSSFSSSSETSEESSFFFFFPEKKYYTSITLAYINFEMYIFVLCSYMQPSFSCGTPFPCTTTRSMAAGIRLWVLSADTTLSNFDRER